MSGLCKFSDIFGKPGEGSHSIRIFNIAVVDVLFTLLASWLLSYVFKGTLSTTIVIFISLMVLSIFIHRLFCVDTTLTKIIYS